MPSLKKISGFEMVKILCNRFGFSARMQKGSHIFLAREADSGTIGCVVPLHDELKLGTMKGILKQARVSEDEFAAAQ
jgi:predicted RNA binding protein YcfA (HicA-like mRNA interferase family)